MDRARTGRTVPRLSGGSGAKRARPGLRGSLIRICFLLQRVLLIFFELATD